MVHTTVLLVLNVATTISSVLLFVSPWRECRHMITAKSTGSQSLLPLIMLFFNCFLWTMYGFLIDSIFPVIVVNGFGCLTCAFFSAIYYRWSTKRAMLLKTFAVVGSFLLVMLAYTVLGVHGVTHQSHAQVQKVLGFVAVAVNIAVYASPLDTIKTVVKTRSAASMPASLCVMNGINGSLWVTFGAVIGDMFMLTSNVIGVALSAVQVALIVKFRPRKQQQTQQLPVTIPLDEVASSKLEFSLVLSPQAQSAANKGDGGGGVRSPEYVSITSPMEPPREFKLDKDALVALNNTRRSHAR